MMLSSNGHSIAEIPACSPRVQAGAPRRPAPEGAGQAIQGTPLSRSTNGRNASKVISLTFARHFKSIIQVTEERGFDPACARTAGYVGAG
jgi:hypothetical protein